jgi:phosphoglycerate dehydrogenase-like enzyme
MKVLFAAPDLKPSTEMDVFWEEPVDPDDPIFAYNVLATPHIAGSTDISIEGIMEAVGENIRRVERGEEPLYQKQSG